ncbi:MAG: hypothetical protein IIA27_15745 [Gemmatimonadetes bacterium]|nr:hypothetical protein [Gemmatimonadota bacterium]
MGNPKPTERVIDQIDLLTLLIVGPLVMVGLVLVMYARGPKHLPARVAVLLLVVAALSTAWIILTVPVDERLNSRVGVFLMAIPAAFAILTSNHESTRKQPLLLFFTAPIGFYAGLLFALGLAIGLGVIDSL